MKHIYTLSLFLSILIGPLFAQTSGPVAPEVRTFSPVEATDMVNLFTGDFNYNIPLFELPGPSGGYPFNIFYNSGVTMTQEASWVGLGWNLNPGAITRTLRNIPDEFDGDPISIYKDMENSWSVGGSFSAKDIEILGKDLGFSKMVKGASFQMAYNNMSGLSMDLGFNLGFAKGAGVGFSNSMAINSGNQSGLGFNPEIGLSFSRSLSDDVFATNGFSLGLNFNTLQGIKGMNFGYDRSLTTISGSSSSTVATAKVGGSVSFADVAFKLGMEDEINGGTVNLRLKLGLEAPTVHTNLEFAGFFSIQKLKHKAEWQSYRSYGYNNLQNNNFDCTYGFDHNKESTLMDFVREKDAMISADRPFLATPIPTYDLFSIDAQGFNAMFRPVRSDIGYFTDPFSKSISAEMDLGVEVGFLTPISVKIGGDASGSGTSSRSEIFCMDPDDDMDVFPQFRKDNVRNPANRDTYFEPYYYQIYGEKHSMSKADFNNLYRGEAASYIPLKKWRLNEYSPTANIKSKLSGISYAQHAFNFNNTALSERASRSQIVQAYKNSEVRPMLQPMSGIPETDGILNQFDFYYYDATDLTESTDFLQDATLKHSNEHRLNFPEHHFAGMEVTQAGGTRYVFGLPVYVNEQVDVSFSTYGCDNVPQGANCPYTTSIPYGNVDDPTSMQVTDSYKHLEVKKIPQYPVAFLLTAVLGPDYVDVTNDGLTDDDLGYWVRFSYVKTSNDYKWKLPFAGANFLRGQESLTADNMAAFTVGSRETWYLVSAETKTHIAEFELSPREDGYGAQHYCQNNNGLGEEVYRLDKISLYAKNERFVDNERNENAVPLKEVAFTYETDGNKELCRNVSNAQPGRGKLTLKSVGFKHMGNLRGLENPYRFFYSYSNEITAQDNPPYVAHEVDRWGEFQPDEADRKNYKFPYTRQGSVTRSGVTYTPQQRAAAWNLKRIQLPVGSEIKIDYEPDDYAYVQNKPAMQMYRVLGVNKENGVDNDYYRNDDHYIMVDMPEFPEEGLSNQEKTNILNAHFKDIKHLYFRLQTDLNKTLFDNNWENISGYCKVTSIEPNYTTGKLKINVENDGGLYQGVINRHPFVLATFNYIKGNRTDLLTSPFNNPQELDNTNGLQKLKAVSSVFTNIIQFYELFLNFEAKCAERRMGKDLDLSQTYVKLPVISGKKKGGGARVSRLTVKENPGDEDSDEVGSVYEYTTDELLTYSDGSSSVVQVSSGVAANEPNIGGDESAIRSFLDYQSRVALFSRKTEFCELPINESLYPSASVGYSKVKVRSLASDKTVSEAASTTYQPVLTKGQAVHEFYTARDFPVITDFTTLSGVGDNDRLRVKKGYPIAPASFLEIIRSYIFASQGYAIELNDMHGKLKQLSYHEQDVRGNIVSEPYSWRKYNYKTKYTPQTVNGRPVQYKLDNEVESMSCEGVRNNAHLIGVDVEQFVDLRRTETYTTDVGVAINGDAIIILGIVIPAPTVYPVVAREAKNVASVVVNKVVHRFGLLESVETYDQGAYTNTRNEVYDELTGAPVLMSVRKSEEGPGMDKTYQYNIQGHWIYAGMDGAYKNIGHVLEPYQTDDKIWIGPVMRAAGTGKAEMDLGARAEEYLKYYHQGDELLLFKWDEVNERPDNSVAVKGIVMGTEQNRLLLDIVSEVDGEKLSGLWYLKVIRSGRRNLPGVVVGSIVSKEDPTLGRTNITCTETNE